MERKPNPKKKPTEPSYDVKREMTDYLRRERHRMERQRMEELLAYKKDFVEFKTDDPIERAKYAQFNNRKIIFTVDSEETDSQEETDYTNNTKHKNDDHHKIYMHNNYIASATSTKSSQEAAFYGQKQGYKCACLSPRNKNFCDKYCNPGKTNGGNSKQNTLDKLCFAQLETRERSTDNQEKLVEEKLCTETEFKNKSTFEQLTILNNVCLITDDPPFSPKKKLLNNARFGHREHDILNLGITNKMKSKKLISRFVADELADNRDLRDTRDTQKDARSRQKKSDKLNMGTTAKLDTRKLIPYELNRTCRNLPYFKSIDTLEIENELTSARQLLCADAPFNARRDLQQQNNSSSCNKNTKCDTKTNPMNSAYNGDEDNTQLIPIYLQKRIVHTDDEQSLHSSSDQAQYSPIKNKHSSKKNNGKNKETSGTSKRHKHPIYEEPKNQYDA